MQIWVDADACPAVVREILFRAAERKKLVTTFVANQNVKLPPSQFLKSFRVQAGFDVADNEIVARSNSGDLVITSDIPLAAELIEKQVLVINFRGEQYTENSIRERLNMRDFFDTLRSSGIQTKGPAAFSQQDRKMFADALDRILARV
ncbi:YaiI/YqxD family protein [Pseudoalteromonas xiamenensis]|uniref:YaiI/YqxD family protein n=1 Tax=Pseudoalteromonas xiamenensis TaxID=882626 RepID=UPI0035ECF3BC